MKKMLLAVMMGALALMLIGCSNTTGETDVVVTYNGNGNDGGVVPSAQVKKAGVSLTLAKNTGDLTKEGYGFAGWNTKEDGSGEEYAGGGIYSKDESITLYARWISNDDTTVENIVDVIANLYGDDVSTVVLNTEMSAVDFQKIRDAIIGNSEAKISVDMSNLDGLDTLPSQSFIFCTNLVSVVLPDNLQTIEESAFSNCSSLESVTIPSSVTTISSSAFRGCSSLKNVTIPDGVATISNATFIGCSSLESVAIPDSVTTIGSKAFYGCSSLKSVTIPSTVTSIEGGAFGMCNQLMFAVESGNTSFSTSDDGRMLFDADKENLLACPSASGEVTDLPDTLTDIGQNAFSSSNLTKVVIPDTVLYIGSECFAGCDKLVEVQLPDSLTSIEEGLFLSCTGLTEITIPANVSQIQYRAFYGCDNLVSISFENTVGWQVFGGDSVDVTDPKVNVSTLSDPNISLSRQD